jgi:hypothetical protein
MAMGPSGTRCQEWPCWLVAGSKLLLCSALLCSKLFPFYQRRNNERRGKKQKSWHWTNIWPWVPAGLDAGSKLLLCSALLSCWQQFFEVNAATCKSVVGGGANWNQEYRRIQEVCLWRCIVLIKDLMCVIVQEELEVRNPVRLVWLPCYEYVRLLHIEWRDWRVLIV